MSLILKDRTFSLEWLTKSKTEGWSPDARGAVLRLAISTQHVGRLSRSLERLLFLAMRPGEGQTECTARVAARFKEETGWDMPGAKTAIILGNEAERQREYLKWVGLIKEQAQGALDMVNVE